jgi:hypothetical protein
MYYCRKNIEKCLCKANGVVEFAKFFIGKPYRASTLEEGDREHLIVNTRQFDCLTFIEIVSSLYLCSLNHEHTFEDYCKRLLSLRYRKVVVTDYTSLLHYFTWWHVIIKNVGIYL